MPAPAKPDPQPATGPAPAGPPPLKMRVRRADGSVRPVTIRPLDRDAVAARLGGVAPAR